MPIVSGIHYFLHEGGKIEMPLFLLHGAGMDHTSWPAEIRRLPHARVFALDLPGHGRSEGPGMQSVADYAASVIAFMDMIGISRAIFAGHALGGAISMSIALDYPERVIGIILVSSGPRLPIPPRVLENAANPATCILAIQSLQELMCFPLEARDLKDRISRQLLAVRPTLFHGDLRACDGFDVISRLAWIKAPALVICGMNDQLTPRRYAETLAGQICGATLKIINDAGHMLMLEQPRQVADQLGVFLSSLPYEPAG
jgi:pimeloyl-ACP methyl ester carboxylesterase